MSQYQKPDKWATTKTSFAKDIANRYRQHCKRVDEAQTLEGFVEYLNGAGLIYDADIGLYMVKAMYPEALYRHNCRKMRAVYELEDVLPLDERHIRRAIKHPKVFSYERNKGRQKRNQNK